MKKLLVLVLVCFVTTVYASDMPQVVQVYKYETERTYNTIENWVDAIELKKIEYSSDDNYQIVLPNEKDGYEIKYITIVPERIDTEGVFIIWANGIIYDYMDFKSIIYKDYSHKFVIGRKYGHIYSEDSILADVTVEICPVFAVGMKHKLDMIEIIKQAIRGKRTLQFKIDMVSAFVPDNYNSGYGIRELEKGIIIRLRILDVVEVNNQDR